MHLVVVTCHTVLVAIAFYAQKENPVRAKETGIGIVFTAFALAMDEPRIN